jgi:hypothetical protein
VTYAGRVRRTFEAWSANQVVAYTPAERRAERLRPATAPARFADDHERALTLEAEAHAEREAAGVTYPERTRRTIRALHELDALARALAAKAADDDERDYAADLAARLARRREAFAAAALSAERAGDEAVERLEDTEPPDDAAAEHAALVDALRAELAARHRQHEAMIALDPAGAERAAHDYEARHADLDTAWNALRRRLGDDT